LPVDIVEGDVLDKASIASALKDARYLIHVAADYRLWTRNALGLMATNVRGTRNVMEEALKSGVEKIVYTSSVCTLKKGPGQTLADESYSLAAHEAFNPYKRSKVLAEEVVRAFVAQAGLRAVIVNPSAPIGPRDIKPTPTGRIIVESASGRVPAFVDTGLNLVHVDDVAEGHLAALKHGIAGESYILGGKNVRLQDMLAEIAKQAGRRPPTLKLPAAAVYPFAAMSEGLAWITGKPPFATRDGLRMAREYMFFDDSKARKSLGYTSRPYEEAVADAIAWFRNAGTLPARLYAPVSGYNMSPR
jgi:dihydroflavonol-4-reductase